MCTPSVLWQRTTTVCHNGAPNADINGEINWNESREPVVFSASSDGSFYANFFRFILSSAAAITIV